MLQISPVLQDNLALEQATSSIRSHTFLFSLFKNNAPPQGRQSWAACTPTLHAPLVSIFCWAGENDSILLNSEQFIDHVSQQVLNKTTFWLCKFHIIMTGGNNLIYNCVRQQKCIFLFFFFIIGSNNLNYNHKIKQKHIFPFSFCLDFKQKSSTSSHAPATLQTVIPTPKGTGIKLPVLPS